MLTHAPQAGRVLASTSDDEAPSSIVRQFLISLVATAVFVTIVLVSAGRASLWQAYVYGALSLGVNIAQRLILRANPELANERAKPGAGAQRSDQALLGVGLVLTLAMLVTAGLQSRYQAEPSLSIGWFILGVALNLAGALLFLWAMQENRYFASVVRIQVERGHSVCTSGPYRIVRHPGNLGMIIGTMGFPMLFQSTWSFIPALSSVAALLVRTQLEDDYLTHALQGYADYREHTRFRIMPGVW